MYARITHYSVDPSRFEEVRRFTEEQLIPAFRRLPGFRHYFGTGDRATGRGYAVTLWDTADQAQALRSALGELVAQIQALGLQLDAPEVQEVVAHAEA